MSDKNKQKIELNFSTITISPESEAFNNTFYYHSDDYFHNKIGSLFGIIQVLDQSEQSEYIPNLLTSIIKKEFYSQPKRLTEESFEMALKKANLALADLAEHDIVNWNNKLHALVGVFKDNTLYFTQVGNASIFLGRNGKFLNLSDSNPTPPSHPIKTFQDIVVGKIDNQDKIILAGPTIYNVFKFNDLIRLFNTFNSKEFDDLILKTIEKEAPDTTILIINTKANIEQAPINQNQENKKNIIGDSEQKSDDIDMLIKDKNFLGEEIKKPKKENSKEKEKTKKEQRNGEKEKEKENKNSQKTRGSLQLPSISRQSFKQTSSQTLRVSLLVWRRNQLRSGIR